LFNIEFEFFRNLNPKINYEIHHSFFGDFLPLQFCTAKSGSCRSKILLREYVLHHLHLRRLL